MGLTNKPIDELTIEDIGELVGNGISESRTLDYKLELHEGGDSGKKELLKDLSAFANTVGGHLIYGIEEEGGIPKQMVGVDVGDFDKFKLHYENLLQTGVDPAIRGVEFHNIHLEEGKSIIVIRVPMSISRPHAVTIKGHFKFHARHSSGVHQLEVDDLRKVFLATESTAMRIRNFRNDRIAQIMTGQAYLPLSPGAKIILHIIPFNSFEVGVHYNWTRENFGDFLPFLETGATVGHKFNLDGILSYLNNSQRQIITSTQVFRNGIVEGIDCLTMEQDGKRRIDPMVMEARIVQAIDKYLASFKKLGIDFPVWAYLSLVEVKGYIFYLSQRYSIILTHQQPIDRNELLLPEIQVDSPDVQGKDILKPAFDLLWNACGFECSKSYDKEGKWKLDKR